MGDALQGTREGRRCDLMVAGTKVTVGGEKSSDFTCILKTGWNGVLERYMDTDVTKKDDRVVEKVTVSLEIPPGGDWCCTTEEG